MYHIIRSDQISCSVVSDSLRPHESQHARPPCPSQTPHLKGLSPEWVLWCKLSFDFQGKAFPHLLHLWAKSRTRLSYFTFTFFNSVQFSHSVVSDSLRPHESQHARPPCLSPIPGVHTNSCPLSWWCHPAISSSVVRFSSCPQFLPA